MRLSSIILRTSVLFASSLFAEDLPKASISDVVIPKMVLYGLEMPLDVTLQWNTQETSNLTYRVLEGWPIDQASVIHEGSLSPHDGKQLQLKGKYNQGQAVTAYSIEGITLSSKVSRYVHLELIQEGLQNPVISSYSTTVHGMPGWVTLIPVIIMVTMCILSDQALFALIIGVFCASWFLNGFNPVTGLLRMLDTYIVGALADSDHAKLALFLFYLSGLIAMVQKSGGAHAVAEKITSLATNRYRGQLATFGVGLAIFLDDTASCMVVGANMQPISDKVLISREKLSFIVHATSACVSSVIPISSWVGFQLALVGSQLSNLNLTNVDPFMLLLESLQSRYYPIVYIFFCGLTIFARREFGSMLVAERRSHFEGKVVEGDEGSLPNQVDPLDPHPDTPLRWWNGAIPIGLTIVITIVSLFLTGYYALLDQYNAGEEVVFNVANIAGAGSPYDSLLYAAFIGDLSCLFLYKVQKIMTVTESVAILVYGIKDVVSTLLILIMAWSIGTAFDDLSCAKFLSSLLSSNLPPQLLPALSFVLGAIISFVTGTSWGTMTILFPLIVPLAYTTAKDDHALFVLTVSSVLSGPLFGDVSSPISANTILTSLSCKVSVQHHVNSQLAYSLLVLLTSLVLGYLPVGYNLYPQWAGLLICCGFVTIVLVVFGGSPASKKLTLSDWIMTRLGFKVAEIKDIDEISRSQEMSNEFKEIDTSTGPEVHKTK
jgi:Na+/H+ antiporter NhaC